MPLLVTGSDNTSPILRDGKALSPLNSNFTDSVPSVNTYDCFPGNVEQVCTSSIIYNSYDRSCYNPVCKDVVTIDAYTTVTIPGDSAACCGEKTFKLAADRKIDSYDDKYNHNP